MLRDFLSKMSLTTYPLFGLLFFFAFFLGVILWVFGRRRETYDEAALLPLLGEREARPMRASHEGDVS